MAEAEEGEGDTNTEELVIIMEDTTCMSPPSPRDPPLNLSRLAFRAEFGTNEKGNVFRRRVENSRRLPLPSHRLRIRVRAEQRRAAAIERSLRHRRGERQTVVRRRRQSRPVTNHRHITPVREADRVAEAEAVAEPITNTEEAAAAANSRFVAIF